MTYTTIVYPIRHTFRLAKEENADRGNEDEGENVARHGAGGEEMKNKKISAITSDQEL